MKTEAITQTWLPNTTLGSHLHFHPLKDVASLQTFHKFFLDLPQRNLLGKKRSYRGRHSTVDGSRQFVSKGTAWCEKGIPPFTIGSSQFRLGQSPPPEENKFPWLIFFSVLEVQFE